MFDGTLLRQRRLEKKMTQRALGDLVGLSASAVGMYESSRRLPDVDTLYRISAALGVPADRLCTGLPQQPPELSDLVATLREILEQADTVTLCGRPLSWEDRRLFAFRLRRARSELPAPAEASPLYRSAGGR